MDNITGPPVRGDQLKFREKDVSEITNRLSVGNSVLLIGLRRIGKSSVMYGVLDQAPKDWTISYHNLQGKRTPSDFFNVLLQSLPKGKKEKVVAYWSQAKTIPNRTINYIKSHFNKLSGGTITTEFQSSIIDYWQPLTQGIEYVIKDTKNPVIIILDELPVYIEHMLKNGTSPLAVEEILGQLRNWRDSYNNFRLFVGGSISFDRIISKHNISASTISDFSRYPLGPFTREEAERFLLELAGSHNLTWYNNEMVSETLEMVKDYYPSFLQAFFMQIRLHGGPDGKPLQVVFQNHFIPSIRQNFFDQFLDRLTSHYTFNDRKIAKEIFNFISGRKDFLANYSQLRSIFSKSKITDSDHMNTLLYDLVCDEFLYFNSLTNEYTFATKLVAHWWSLTGRK